MLAGGRKSNLARMRGLGPRRVSERDVEGEDEWDPGGRMEGGMQERGGGPRERAVESPGSWQEEDQEGR